MIRYENMKKDCPQILNKLFLILLELLPKWNILKERMYSSHKTKKYFLFKRWKAKQLEERA